MFRKLFADTSLGIGIVAATHEYGSFYFDNGDSTRTEKGAQIYLGYQLSPTWSAEASSALPDTYGAYSSRKAFYAAGMEYMIIDSTA